jgi:propanediol dehydratase small subunit
MHEYPLADRDDDLRAASGRSFDDISLDAALNGELTPGDLAIRAETLRAQAEIAREAGHPQLAANLLRAAELTAVPDDELLKIYDLLRPGRATSDQLAALADMLEANYNAVENARFVREAAEVYQARGLLRREA